MFVSQPPRTPYDLVGDILNVRASGTIIACPETWRTFVHDIFGFLRRHRGYLYSLEETPEGFRVRIEHQRPTPEAPLLTGPFSAREVEKLFQARSETLPGFRTLRL